MKATAKKILIAALLAVMTVCLVFGLVACKKKKSEEKLEPIAASEISENFGYLTSGAMSLIGGEGFGLDFGLDLLGAQLDGTVVVGLASETTVKLEITDEGKQAMYVEYANSDFNVYMDKAFAAEGLKFDPATATNAALALAETADGIKLAAEESDPLADLLALVINKTTAKANDKKIVFTITIDGTALNTIVNTFVNLGIDVAETLGFSSVTAEITCDIIDAEEKTGALTGAEITAVTAGNRKIGVSVAVSDKTDLSLTIDAASRIDFSELPVETNVRKIIADKALTFTIGNGTQKAVIDAGDYNLGIQAKGEVIWEDKVNPKVAVDFTLDIDGKDANRIRVVYDGSATTTADDDLLRVAVNNAYVSFTRTEIQSVPGEFKEIIGSLSSGNSDNASMSLASAAIATADAATGGVVSGVLDAVFGVVEKLSVSYNKDTGVYTFGIGDSGNVTVNENELKLTVAIGGTDITLDLDTPATKGTVFGEIKTALTASGMTDYTTEVPDSPAQRIISFAFAALDEITFENVLDGKVAHLGAKFDGSKLAIAELPEIVNGISADLDVYYGVDVTNSDGDTIDGNSLLIVIDKLVVAGILDDGLTVSLHYNNRHLYVYVSLGGIYMDINVDTVLADMSKIMEKLSGLISQFTGGSASATAATTAATQLDIQGIVMEVVGALGGIGEGGWLDVSADLLTKDAASEQFVAETYSPLS